MGTDQETGRLSAVKQTRQSKKKKRKGRQDGVRIAVIAAAASILAAGLGSVVTYWRAQSSRQPSVGDQSRPIDSGSDKAVMPAVRPESATASAPRFRRPWKWVVTNPEKALGIGALLTAAISAIAAVISFSIASQALNDQTASNQANRDIQIRSFASKVSISGASAALSGPAATMPDTLDIFNLNNGPVGDTSIVVGVNAHVQFSSDGSAYTNAISWRSAFTLGKMGPCSRTILNVNRGTGNDVGSDPGLIFIDNNALTWYREADGVLVQVQLELAQQKSFLVNLIHAPYFPRTEVSQYKSLTGCS